MTGYSGQIVDSPDASGAVLPLVLTFARESRGWVRMTCRRAEWFYSATERR